MFCVVPDLEFSIAEETVCFVLVARDLCDISLDSGTGKGGGD